MDTFFEQIIAVKKNGKAVAAIIGIWLAAFIVCFLLIMFMGFLGTFSLLLAAGALLGAYKLCTRFNLEYEYIVTNGTMEKEFFPLSLPPFRESKSSIPHSFPA